MSFFRKVFLGEWTYNLGRAKEESVKYPKITADLSYIAAAETQLEALSKERDDYRKTLETLAKDIIPWEATSPIEGCKIKASMAKKVLARYPKGEVS